MWFKDKRATSTRSLSPVQITQTQLPNGRQRCSCARGSCSHRTIIQSPNAEPPKTLPSDKLNFTCPLQLSHTSSKPTLFHAKSTAFNDIDTHSMLEKDNLERWKSLPPFRTSSPSPPSPPYKAKALLPARRTVTRLPRRIVPPMRVLSPSGMNTTTCTSIDRGRGRGSCCKNMTGMPWSRRWV